jgi:putative ABC transport system permease protein
MRAIRRTLSRLGALVRRGDHQSRLAEELDTHLAMHIDGNLRAGMSLEDARREALLAAGGLQVAADACRDQQRLPLIETTLHDVRYGLRVLGKAPGFAAVVTLTLAIGIGANTAIYSVTQAVMTPFAMAEPGRVMFVWTDNTSRGWRQLPASVPDFEDWARSGVFTHLGAVLDTGFNVRVGNETERVNGLRVSGGGFDVFGVPAALGRTFRAEDSEAGRDHVAILSDAVWRTRFGADPSIVGTTLVIDGTPHAVVGVLPAAFPRFSHEEIYTPLVFRGPHATDRGTRNLAVVGRLAPRLGIAAAQRRMAEVSRQLAEQFPDADAGNVAWLQPIEEAVVEDARVILAVLFGAVGLMLLIACANIANLLLARGASRAREMALRAALGASRSRLCRQLLVEHVLLAAMGGILALLPAIAGMRFITSFQLDELPNGRLATLNMRVLAFNIALSLVTGVLFGMVPAWQAWQTDVQRALKTALGSTASAIHHRLRGAFVIVELALAIVLLVAAGLLVRSFQQLRSTDPGYDPQNVLTMRVALSETRYATPVSQLAFYDRLRTRMTSLPGVAGVSAANELPTTDDYHAAGLWTSDQAPARQDDLPIVLYESVMADYFRVMRVAMLEGRAFAGGDRPDAPLVAIVDRSTAARNWSGQTAIGKRLKLGRTEPWREVVGVVADMEQPVLVKILKGRLGQVYLPFAQAPKTALSLVIRTTGDPAGLIPAIRDIARTTDIDQPLFQIQTLTDARAAGRAAHRLATTLLTTFACVALLLATLGIYGVVANNVGERTREFGIRMSLGAQPRDVLTVVFRNALALLALGTVIGIAVAFALTRSVSSLLVGIRPTDPLTFAGVVVLLGLAGLLASYIPARRATRVDPMLALRCE